MEVASVDKEKEVAKVTVAAHSRTQSSARTGSVHINLRLQNKQIGLVWFS